MKKIITLCIGLLLLTADVTFGQGENQITVDQLQEYVTQKGVYQTRISRNVRGTPYLNNDWLQGHLVLENDAQTEPIMLRLNTFDQEIEFVRNEEVLVIPPSSLNGLVIYNEFGNIQFKNGYRSEEHDITPNMLLRVIHDGNTKLLVEHVTVLQEDMASYGTASQQDEYIDSRNYFLVTPDGTFNEIRLRKRDILRQLDSHSDQIELHVKQNGLDYGEESEVGRILEHYDSLLQNESAGGSGGN